MDLIQIKKVRAFYALTMEQSRIVSIIVTVSIASILPVGYHIVVLNVPEPVVQAAIQTELYHNYRVKLSSSSLSLLWSFVVSCQSIGALFGCLALIPFLGAFGVKTALLLANNIILFTGSVFLFASYYLETTLFLVIGRILVGVYTGLATGLLPIFISELAPIQIKGALSCFVHIAVLLGAAIGALLSLDTLLGDSRSWGLLLAAPGVCVIFLTVFARCIPETPGYYLSRGKFQHAADSARYYYNLQCYEDSEAVQQYREFVVKMPEQRSFLEACRNRNARRGIGLGVLVSAAQILSGTMAVATYSSAMFSTVSITRNLTTFFPALGSLLSILASLPALRLVETCGRRPLLISTLVVCALANYLLCATSLAEQYFQIKSTNFAVFTVMFISFLLLGVGYNFGVGPIAYFLCVELVDVHFVSVAMSCSIAINWITNLIVTLAYYPLLNAVGGYSYLLFAIPTTLIALVLQRYLPETKYMSSKLETAQIRLSCNAAYADELQRPYGTFSA